MSATEERDEVSGLSRTNTAAALAMARRISDPWFRCQALAEVARYASTESVFTIAQQAYNDALQQGDPYKAVGASAWPVRAVIERNQTEALPLWLNELVKRARGIDQPLSRLEALFLLWQAAFPFEHSETDEIFEEFVRACGSANSWKAGSRLEEGILMLASRHPSRAIEFAESMRDGKYRRRTLKRLSEHLRLQPRSFFRGDT